VDRRRHNQKNYAYDYSRQKPRGRDFR
jgi:hypothetical protein